MPWIDPDFPKTATPSDLVGRVLGLNPGMMTGPGTNTYLVGGRDPILIDTGIGLPEYVPNLDGYLRERGWRQPSRVVWLFDNGKVAGVAQENNVHTNLHNRGANISFLDGRATRFKNMEYWNFKTNKGRLDNPNLIWYP